MARQTTLESRWQAVLDHELVQELVRLPSAVGGERRNVAARHAILCRIHGEFTEMPGLSLTPQQAAKLFGLPVPVASRIIDQLIDAQVLRPRRGGRFVVRGAEP
jgi:hypothetical protein